MVRKYLQFYRLTYGIKPPYNLILDGNFIFAALKNKIDIKERVQRVLQGEEVRYYVLKSVLDELRSVGEKAADALQFAQSCIQLDDSRINGVTPTDKTIGFLSKFTSYSSSFNNYTNLIPLIACLWFHRSGAERAEAAAGPGVSGGRPRSHQFFVATQDRELRGVLGSLSGFPLLYLNQGNFLHC
jgi:U3 small nucleolar RNA-associated protein 23